QARLLRQFFDSQQLDRAHLIGYSMGGWISLKFASQSPERLSHLVLIASPGMTFLPPWDRRILKAGSTHALRELIRVEGGNPPPVFILRDVVRVANSVRWIVDGTVDSMFTGQDVLDGKLDQVKMPVLLMWGKQDGLVPTVVADSMRHEMPQSSFELFDG